MARRRTVTAARMMLKARCPWMRFRMSDFGMERRCLNHESVLKSLRQL